MRSEHAERDGKTFHWDDPPDGGHPGEAPGCRCWAEDVEKDCTAERLELRQIVEELIPLEAELVKLKAEISNLQVAIEQNIAAIEFLEDLKAALEAGALASRFPNPYVKIAGMTSAAAAQAVASKILEIEAELRENTAKLANLKKKLPKLEREVQSLKNQEKIAKDALDACEGK